MLSFSHGSAERRHSGRSDNEWPYVLVWQFRIRGFLDRLRALLGLWNYFFAQSASSRHRQGWRRRERPVWPAILGLASVGGPRLAEIAARNRRDLPGRDLECFRNLN